MEKTTDVRRPAEIRRRPFQATRKVLAVIVGWVIAFAGWACLLRITHWGSFQVAGSVDQGLLLEVWMMSWAGPLAAALGGFTAGAISGGRGWRYGASVAVVSALLVLAVSGRSAADASWLWVAPYPLLAVAAALMFGSLGGDVGRSIVQRDRPDTKRRAWLLASSFVAIPLFVVGLVHGHSPVKPAVVADVFSAEPQIRLLRTTSSLVAVDGEIVGVDTNSGKTQKLAKVSGTAVETGVLSPDGSRLSYIDSIGVGHLVILDLATGGTIAMTDFIQCGNPTWSPNSAWIAFECHEGEIAGVYVVQADGSGKPARIASFPQARFNLHHRLQWSPDSQRLYLERNEDSGRHATICEIDLRNATESVVATDCMGDSWVTDGRALLFQRESPSRETVWLRKEIGSSQEQEIGDEHIYGYSASPDGSRIIGWTGQGRVFIELLGDQRRIALPEGTGTISEVAWSTDSSMCALLTSSDLRRRYRVIRVDVPELRVRTLCMLDGGHASAPVLVAPSR